MDIWAFIDSSYKGRDGTPETGQDVLWALGRRSPQALIQDQFLFSKFSPIVGSKELGIRDRVKITGKGGMVRKGAGLCIFNFCWKEGSLYLLGEYGRFFQHFFSPINYVFFPLHFRTKMLQCSSLLAPKELAQRSVYHKCIILRNEISPPSHPPVIFKQLLIKVIKTTWVSSGLREHFNILISRSNWGFAEQLLPPSKSAGHRCLSPRCALTVFVP